jgi:aminopeptidase N
VFFFGKEVLKEGCTTYFAKYPFKNTELKDFVAEMSKAAVKLGLDEVDMENWSSQWLYSAGCNEIGIDVSQEDGKITNCNVVQSIYGKHEKNRLRC